MVGMSGESGNRFGQTSAEYEATRRYKPGVRASMQGDAGLEASVWCSGPHGDDGRGRWRVAVLTKHPRRLVTDDENVSWPDVPSRTVLASCRECWRVPCRDCTDEGTYCPHSSKGEWVIEVAKMQAELRRSEKNILISDLLPTSLAEDGERS